MHVSRAVFHNGDKLHGVGLREGDGRNLVHDIRHAAHEPARGGARVGGRRDGGIRTSHRTIPCSSCTMRSSTRPGRTGPPPTPASGSRGVPELRASAIRCGARRSPRSSRSTTCATCTPDDADAQGRTGAARPATRRVAGSSSTKREPDRVVVPRPSARSGEDAVLAPRARRALMSTYALDVGNVLAARRPRRARRTRSMRTGFTASSRASRRPRGP